MLKFKKNSVFKREHKNQENSVLEGLKGILAVWGSPSSGKTTVAIKLAKYLADKKKNVTLLLCDMTAPMLPAIIPQNELEIEKSLGSILSATHITQTLVKYNMITLKSSSYLTIIGMLKGENEYTYASFSRVQAEELIDCLKEIADYVIIDCSSYLANDILSSVALYDADNVLRLINCDLKSLNYLSSQLPLLQNNRYDTENHYKIASNVKPNHSVEKMMGAVGNVPFTIPYSQEVEEQFLQGNLLLDLNLKNSRGFKESIKKICREVFNV